MEHLLVYVFCSECSNNYIIFISEDNRKLVCPYCNNTNDFWKDTELTPINHRND